MQSPAENLYLCRSRNGKVEETAENAKNRRRRGCGKKSLELVHRDFYDAFSSRACFCLIKLILQLRHFLLTKLVASLVVFHTRVTFDPVPFHIERSVERVEFLPKFLIEHRLFCRCFPAVLFPVVNPARDSVFDILAVDVHLDWESAEPFGVVNCSERADCGGEFHAVVRGEFFAATQFTSLAFRDDNASPAAHARISPASAVGIYDDFFHRRSIAEKRGEVSPQRRTMLRRTPLCRDTPQRPETWDLQIKSQNVRIATWQKMTKL